MIQINHPDPAHITTVCGYDPRGNLIMSTDANPHTTQSAFRRPESRTETLLSDTLTQARNYDAAGNLTSLTDDNGHTTTYTYDAMNPAEQAT